MRRWHFIIAFVAVLLGAIGLYQVKTETAKTRAHIADLTRDVKEERAAVRARRAELAHLEGPARIEALAKENLELEDAAESRARPESAINSTLPPPEKLQAQ